ncbi:MAG: hypothetical protein ACRCZ0_02660 [Cetobacterium sp.]
MSKNDKTMIDYDYLSNLRNGSKVIRDEELKDLEEAKKSFKKMIVANAGKYQYYVGYAIYEGQDFRGFDSANFFVDREILSLEDVFYLDYVVSGHVKPENGFVKIISFAKLEVSGTHKRLGEEYSK